MIRFLSRYLLASGVILICLTFTVSNIKNQAEIRAKELLLFKKSLTFQCGSGQLGNRMFFYASAYGLARLNKRSCYLQKCNVGTCRFTLWNCRHPRLDETFEISIPVGPDLPKEMQVGHPIRFSLRFPEDYRIAPEANILVGERYPNSVTFFWHVRDEIRREFTFKPKYKENSQKILRSIASGPNVTFIGVHVRRDSFISHLASFKLETAPLKFYLYGLSYFRRKYGNAVFVVTSDDLEWCRTNLVGSDIHVLKKMGSQEEDMALLSFCNHTLFDYGTYGLWAAFLAGGEAMYYIDGIVDNDQNDTLIGKRMYPPEWNGISKAMLNALV